MVRRDQQRPSGWQVVDAVDLECTDEFGQHGLGGAAWAIRGEKPIEAGHVHCYLSPSRATQRFKEWSP
jgi:hypothetical protein